MIELPSASIYTVRTEDLIKNYDDADVIEDLGCAPMTDEADYLTVTEVTRGSVVGFPQVDYIACSLISSKSTRK